MRLYIRHGNGPCGMAYCSESGTLGIFGPDLDTRIKISREALLTLSRLYRVPTYGDVETVIMADRARVRVEATHIARGCGVLSIRVGGAATYALTEKRRIRETARFFRIAAGL